ncbi:Uncharacterised protein [Mycobacteroides abscessus subsp. abscessus]|nr:Uncharacterised protein [Mycobacteroides abscessus subsp. abscessus]
MKIIVTGNSLAMYLKWLLIATPELLCHCRKCRSSMIKTRTSQDSTQSKARRA